ncbi:MAG: hypothetical protein MUC87_11760 [Bacteroidia bacterium]|jgi:hypothetical protein|nr:hypothetical protein [Bacteroidia bacterium]
MNLPHRKLFALGTLLAGAILFVLVFVKARNSSFTHDESFSYLQYCGQSFSEIISFSDWYTNNHILNSLGMKYAELGFGNSELALRLPNLLLLLVFMYYAYRLFNTGSWLADMALFLILCTNCLLMNLFGMARGYGLSCGFMMMSLYHFLEYTKTTRVKHLALFHIAAMLASLSSFTLLTFYASAMIIYNILLFIQDADGQKRMRMIWRSNLRHLPFLLLSAGVLYEPVRRLVSYSALDFGGKEGFYSDTVYELVFYIMQSWKMPVFAMFILKLFFTLVVLVPLGIIIMNALRRNTAFFSENKGLVVTTLLPVIISLIIVLQHIILGADYPVGRFSIFLFPLLVVQIGFFVKYLLTKRFRVFMLSFITSAMFISVLSFALLFDFRKNAEWWYDSDTKDAMQGLRTEYHASGKDKKPYKLCVSPIFEPTVNFYRVTKEYNWLQPVTRNPIDSACDYVYMFEKEINLLNNWNYTVVKRFPGSGTILVRVNHR